MDEFEKEIRSILDEKFIEKAKNLKKSGHIFNPIFYLFFTRLVEASGIFNNIVLPNELELEELFKTRKDFLQIDYETISELLRRVWLYERNRGVEFEFEKTSEDMLFLIYRLGKIQSEIDRAILKHAEWSKEKLIDLYFTLLRVLIEIEDEINRRIRCEA
jgi:RNAse (barnase) inhibitor barstar